MWFDDVSCVTQLSESNDSAAILSQLSMKLISSNKEKTHVSHGLPFTDPCSQQTINYPENG
jgi:hypothetical protein